jgi:hypothetical protein
MGDTQLTVGGGVDKAASSRGVGVEAIRNDQGKVAACGVESLLEGGCLKEAEKVIDGISGDSVGVVMDVAMVDGYSQSEAVGVVGEAVIAVKDGGEVVREGVQEQVTADIGRCDDQGAVTAVLAVAIPPGQPRHHERFDEMLIHPRAEMILDGGLVPGAEAGDVDGYEGCVQARERLAWVVDAVDGRIVDRVYGVPTGLRRAEGRMRHCSLREVRVWSWGPELIIDLAVLKLPWGAIRGMGEFRSVRPIRTTRKRTRP